jgi:hypothetical protein
MLEVVCYGCESCSVGHHHVHPFGIKLKYGENGAWVLMTYNNSYRVRNPDNIHIDHVCSPKLNMYLTYVVALYYYLSWQPYVCLMYV